MTQQTKLKAMSRKLATGVITLGLTGVIIAASGLAVLQGSATIANRAAAVEPPPATEPIAVQVAQIEMADGYSIERNFSGQIEAPQTAALSFELSGTLSTVNVDEGEKFAAGDILATLDDRMLKADIDRLEASKRALNAQLELAKITDKRQSDLLERGFTSAQAADQTRLSVIELNARLAEIDASILAAQIQLEKTQIRAPFSGRVNERIVDPGNTIGAAQPVLRLVDDGKPVFRVGIAPELAEQFSVGDALEVTLSDQSYQAEIIAILPQIDPVTRTRTVRAQLADGVNLAFGSTGSASFDDRVDASGSWVPLTAIEDGVRGLWTIKTIRDGEPATVGVEAVELLYADGERAYVRGTFADQTKFITDGVHRVVVGQTVRIAQ